MTKNDWENCNSASEMIEFLWSKEPLTSIAKVYGKCLSTEEWNKYLEHEIPLYRFYLASCRNIWEFLPLEESRNGVELAEKYIDGIVTFDQVNEYSWHTEGAAFCIEYNSLPEKIAVWVREVESISTPAKKKMLNLPETAGDIEAREILLNAAYFAHYAMMYPTVTPKGPPRKGYLKFMFPDVLREYVSYPEIKA